MEIVKHIFKIITLCGEFIAKKSVFLPPFFNDIKERKNEVKEYCF
jgi:hypothetical protein